MSKTELEKYVDSELWQFWMENPTQSVAGYSMFCEGVKNIIDMVIDREPPYFLTGEDYLKIGKLDDPRILSAAERLLQFKPLTSLTGAEREWEKIYTIGSVVTWQNKRYCRVMKDTTLTGKLLKVYEWIPRDNDIREVKFPYWPGL